MKYRRFGKTELELPVISCGGMRYQESWNDSDPVTDENQRKLEACIRRSIELGIHHIETARGYGTSERQLGKILPTLPRDEIIVQTKVGPTKNPAEFRAVFDHSMELLNLDYVDLFAFHGVNNLETLEHLKNCIDTALQWKKEGRVRHIGFSTHGHVSDILNVLELEVCEYVNLHWYYFFQDNWPAIEEATRQDMGVFIISPNDKGGKLYEPTDKLCELTEPLHPMVFNGLFCLSRPEVHTLSCGVARPEDFEIHLETAEKSAPSVAAAEIAPIIERLEAEAARVLGDDWVKTWQQGLPEWQDTPGEITMPWVLRLRNLALAFDMVEFGKMRYNLLGKGDHWFPGNQADKAGTLDLSECLKDSPHADVIPAYLAEAHELLQGEEVKRLMDDGD